MAPPAAPPVQVRLHLTEEPFSRRGEAALQSGGGSVYSIGEPSDEEQLYVEFINRARANPPAEGERLAATTDPEILAAYDGFSVDLALMKSQFNAIAAAPPLSIHPLLTLSARRHAEDMFVHAFQGHDGTDGSNVGTRATDAGYVWRRVGENVYANAESVWHGHVGFNSDWGPGPGGMQTPPGHRISIHSPNFREIGVGVTNGFNGKVGPQVVSQSFGDRNGITPMVTGVVYYDFNQNQFYDLGEGLGGVTVRVSNTPWRAVTARSGGYSVPVGGDGTYTVTFEVPGMAPVARTATVASQANVKVDLIPGYSAPGPAGPASPPTGSASRYTFPSVGGATTYGWRASERSAWSEVGGAEGGLGSFVADVPEGLSVIAGDRRQSGTSSFRLGVLSVEDSAWLTLPKNLRVSSASILSFWSRHTYGGTAQHARVQVSPDQGRTWLDLWSQTGSGDAGEASFVPRTVPLGEFADQVVWVRFAYTIAGTGSVYPANQPDVGWYLDDITVSDAVEIQEVASGEIPEGSLAFDFVPPSAGSYDLEVRARVGDRALPWSPPFVVQAVDAGSLPLRVRMGVPRVLQDGTRELPFRVEQGVLGSPELRSAASPLGPWLSEGTATFGAGPNAGDRWVRISPASGHPRFYRLVAP